MNYYNENDPKAAAWLRELIRAGHISNGVVDERSIVDVRATDLHEYQQCHFFAGIGGWSYALRLAGIPDNEPIWTGSCPCQPFSQAGKQLGIADARHLWPIFFNLIAQCEPATVFGEQVASKAGREWLARVFADLENVAYATAGADLCAASVGSPQIRQRLFWVALANGGLTSNGELQRGRQHGQQQENSFTDRVEHATGNGREQRRTESSERGVISGCGSCRMGNPNDLPGARLGPHGGKMVPQEGSNGHHPPDPWSRSELLPCSDGKTRRIEPGSFPLAHGIPGRVGLLRGYGNAIVPQVAARFIQAFYEARHDVRSDVLMSDPMF